MGGDMDAVRKACDRARREGGPVRSCGETVRGVMGRACAILENECTDLAELLVRPLMALGQSLDIGLPQKRPDI
eukprot:13193675-Alexandrium_andersonii.AAC.1